MSQPIRGQGGLFLIGPNNTKLVEDIEILLPVKFRWILFSGHRGEVENVSANQRHGGHLVPPIDPKNINLLVDVEILRPVKFCWISFSGFRGEVENASANQRPGWLSCSSDRPEKHKRGRRRWDLASCEFCWIPSCFSNRPEKHQLGGGRLDLASFQVSLNSN